MDYKETEKELEQAANSTKLRDFSKVWEEIKDKIEVPQKPQKKVWVKKYFPAILAACFALIFAIALPIYLHNIPKVPNVVFYADKLIAAEVDETAFFAELSKGKVTHVSFSAYKTSGYTLYQTENGDTKGGYLEICDDVNAPTEIITIKFYDESVKLEEESKKVYESTYTKSGLTASYNVGECYPEYNVYVYEMLVSYNKVNYIIDYMGDASDPIIFFNSFFK